MTFGKQKSKKEKLRRIPHILAGFVILLHGLERWESGHGTYIFFLFAGAIFLSVAIFHHSLSARFPFIDTVFFVIESVLSLIIAYEYFAAGKKGLPYIYLLASLLQLAAIFMFYKRTRNRIGDLS